MSDTGAEEEARARRRAQLEQRHLEAYRNLHRLRDALHLRYAALLKDKVQSQRLLLQQRHEAARTKSESDAKQKLKKLAFSKLQHNDSYLTSLPKTSYHLIFDLQTQLAVQGHLKTHHDLEDFHRCIKYNDHPSQLQRSLQDIKRKMLGKKTDEDRQKPPCTGEERGHTGDFSHSRLMERETGSVEISAELIFGSLKISETDQMFPKMKVPTFATLQPNFMKNFQSKMPDLVVPVLPEKSRKAEIYMGRLRQMHHLSLINMAFSQRLLDKDSDALLSWKDEGGVQDLVLPNIDSKQKQKSQTLHPRLSSPKQPRSVQNNRGSCPKRPSRVTSSSQPPFEAMVLEPAARGSKTPEPLCIEDVCQQKHVVIIDRGVKLWRNYT